jgi:hypothetical protein
MNRRRLWTWTVALGLLAASLLGRGGAPWVSLAGRPPLLLGRGVPQAVALLLSIDWTYDGNSVGDELGYAVAAAGDVNGDGYGDVVVGAPKDQRADGVYKEGVVYVFHGSYNGLWDDPDTILGGDSQGSLFGTSVGTAGDVNDDGYDDLIVGAPAYKNGTTTAGGAFVFLGSEDGLHETPGWVFVSDQKDSNLGISVGTAGSVNGDGYADVVVGARWYSGDQVNAGRIYVFYGSDGGLSETPNWMADGDRASAGLGSSVGAAGDVNGDGYDDIIAGAPFYEEGGIEQGAAFVFYGSSTGLGNSPPWIVYGGQEGAEFGTSVGTAGNVNGDAYADVVVGAPYYDGTREDEGAAFGFYGTGSGPGQGYDWSASSRQAESGFGISVATAGDLNDDGFDDVVVGAHHYQRDQADEGVAFVFHGSTVGLSPESAWRAEGDKAATEFGFSVGTAGKVNSDTYDDLIVGAPNFRVETELRGKAFAYYGPIEAQYWLFLPLVVRDGP